MSDPNFANVVLLAFNENGADGSTSFDDASNSNHTLTANGNAQWDTAQAPVGLTSSILFDGAGDWLTVADNADLELGSGDFTIEGWIRPNSTAAGFRSVLSKRASEPSFGYLVVAQNGSALQLFASSNTASWNIASSKAMGSVATGNWYHWAVSRSGNTWHGFVGGVQGSGFPFTSSASVSDNAAALAIGAGAADGGQPYNGWIASVRMTVGTARYTANFTPPSLPFPDSGESNTGALVAGSAVVAGSGVSGSTGTGALTAQGAVLAGAGVSASTGTGSLASQGAIVNGAGTAKWIATGALVAGSAIVVGGPFIAVTGTGELAAGAADIIGLGRRRRAPAESITVSVETAPSLPPVKASVSADVWVRGIPQQGEITVRLPSEVLYVRAA